MADGVIYRVRVNGKLRGTYKTKQTATKRAFEMQKKAPSAAMLIERIGDPKKRKKRKPTIKQVVQRYIVCAGRVFKL